VTIDPIPADPIDELRARTSVKWTMFPPDVLPLFVAEMDYPLAPAIRETLLARVAASDTGYANGSAAANAAFAGFAAARWGWRVDPEAVMATTDVSVAVVETLRAALAPGDPVVVMPPVYPPFFEYVAEAGLTAVEVPLARGGTEAEPAWSIDLDGVAAALAAGARGVLLCNPHNPTGTVHDRATLARLAELAAEHGAVVVSDEIHAPLVHSDATFTPFLDVPGGAEVGIAAHSASKAWNLAGLKCAFIVAGSERGRALLASMPMEVGWRASILGIRAAESAYRDSVAHLDGVVAALEASRAHLARLVRDELPGVVLHEPRASFVAWLDLRALGLGDDPAEPILEHGRVALSRGLDFGAPGAGFARINFACAPDVLEDAARRIAALR
jgi:cysteine-S-conjugate beta-lyase